MKSLKDYLKLSFLFHVAVAFVLIIMASVKTIKRLPSISIKSRHAQNFSAYFKNGSGKKNGSAKSASRSKKTQATKQQKQKVGTQKTKKEAQSQHKKKSKQSPKEKPAPKKKTTSKKEITEKKESPGTKINVGKKATKHEKKNKKKTKKKEPAQKKEIKKKQQEPEREIEEDVQDDEKAAPEKKQPEKKQDIVPEIDPEIDADNNTELVDTQELADDINILGDYDDGQLLVYQRRIRDEIARLWRPPLGVKEGTFCTVKFTVDARGAIVKHEFTKRSQMLIFDSSISQMISKLAFHTSLWGKEFTVDFKQ